MGSALQAVRVEMDTLVLRCSMSPGIRQQQDEFNVVTNEKGQMLVSQPRCSSIRLSAVKFYLWASIMDT